MGNLALNSGDLNSLEGVAAPNLRGQLLGPVVAMFIPYVLTAAGFVLLLMLISGGFSYLTSGGDPKKTEGAKGRITSALIGFFVIFFAYLIVRLVGILFDVTAINSIF